MPILIISGDEDPVGELGKGVIKISKMYEKNFEDVSTRLFINGRHAFLDEDEAAINCICNWLDERIKRWFNKYKKDILKKLEYLFYLIRKFYFTIK